jgi:hypothetical protein
MRMPDSPAARGADGRTRPRGASAALDQQRALLVVHAVGPGDVPSSASLFAVFPHRAIITTAGVAREGQS